MKVKKSFWLIAGMLSFSNCSRTFELEAQFGTVQVKPHSGLVTTETGGQAMFSVLLDRRPESTVTIALRSSNLNRGTLDKSALVFSEQNWFLAQTVTITGVNDNIADGDHDYTIEFEPLRSADANFSQIQLAPVQVTNRDSGAPGFVISTTAVTVSEPGGFPNSASFTMRLSTPPSANVTIPVSSSNTAEATVSPTSFTFSPANWNTDQIVIVTGVTDNKIDSNVAFTIVMGAAGSSDAAYNLRDPADVAGTNNDIDGLTGKYLYVTNTVFDGVMGGLAGVDAICNSDSARPRVGTYKAFIASYDRVSSTILRDASTNWILFPSQKYYRYDGQYLGTTNASGVFLFPLNTTINPSFLEYWTGMNASYLSNSGSMASCTPAGLGQSWTANSSTNGATGRSDRQDSTTITGGGPLCSVVKHLLCAEQ